MKKQTLFVHISETTMEERRQRQKMTSALSVQSMECGHIFTKESVAAEFTTRKHFAGNSASNVIGPVSLIPEDSAWTRTVKDKREIYGKENRVAPGGRTPGVDAQQAKALLRKPEDLEPVFYFSFPWQFYEDVCSCLGARTITALTLGDGSTALAAMFLGKPFVGVALTEEHATGVRKHLANTVFKGFSTDGSPFYDARIASELAEAGLSKAHQTMLEEQSAEGKAKAKTKAKAKAAAAKAESKKRAAAAAEAEGDGGAGGSAGGGAPPPKKKGKPVADSVANKMKLALAALGGGGADDDDEAGDGDEDDVAVE